jgi:hypothetical protein
VRQGVVWFEHAGLDAGRARLPLALEVQMELRHCICTKLGEKVQVVG